MGTRTRGDVEGELRALFDEVAEVDWRSPAWRGLVAGLAASEVWQERALTPSAAADAFVTALEANSGPAADTFMAAHGAPAPADREGRIERALERAWAVARTLRAHNQSAPGQRLLQAMQRRGGWLRGVPLEDGPAVKIAFLTPDGAFLGSVDPRTRAGIEPLRTALRQPAWSPLLRAIDRDAAGPTPAAAAISLMPVTQTWARSFHRAAWTRGGGPWMGVADSVPFAVVSTCHAAVDGYAHARVCSEVLTPGAPGPSPLASDPFAGVAGVTPPAVGFAARAIAHPAPRFAVALHSFGRVLERHLGDGSTRGVPMHIPIAPGRPSDRARWRRRPLYGLLALQKDRGQLESLEALTARLPAFLAREASGRGVLTRVLRAGLELPVPSSVRRAMIHRQPWADRLFAPARVLTGGGYLSWMRFPPGERPRLPTFPSAIPSFTGGGRGGAGLSIARWEGGLAVGLTTSGSLGTSTHADTLLDEWIASLPAVADASPGRASEPGA